MRGSCPRLRNRKRTRRITVRLLAASLKAPKKRAHVLGLRVIGTVDRLEDGERAIEVEARLDRIALRCNHEPKASVHAGDVRMLRVVRVLDQEFEPLTDEERHYLMCFLYDQVAARAVQVDATR